ncbi:MAG: putative LPS assembly protein LptD, partial [Nitrospirota bacterium]
MGRRRWSVLCPSFLAFLSVLVTGIPPTFSAQADPPQTVLAQPASAQPIEITAERIDYLKGPDIYEAEGSVVIVQGPLRLTADRVTIMMLSGTLIATGHVHLSDPTSDMRSERLELDVNTEAGVVTNGELNIKLTDTLVTGRLFQRFSEDHYRVKDGSFTNCDAKEGKIPAWRFTFKDVDLNMGQSVYAKDVWLCVNDIPLVPFPTLAYPIQTARKSGLLIPTVGYDNRFGTHYRQGYFWAVNPSQDLTITPDFLANRGYGGDLEYRYVLNRKSRGQWLLTFIQDTEVNQARATLTGKHMQKVNPDLSIRAEANLLSDPKILSDLSNSGVLRALPSQESNLNITQRFKSGNLYLYGQYLQPLSAGGTDTFQRLPEIGHRLVNVSPFGGPLLLGMDT